jgi:hypothetical protein
MSSVWDSQVQSLNPGKFGQASQTLFFRPVWDFVFVPGIPSAKALGYFPEATKPYSRWLVP